MRTVKAIAAALMAVWLIATPSVNAQTYVNGNLDTKQVFNRTLAVDGGAFGLYVYTGILAAPTAVNGNFDIKQVLNKVLVRDGTDFALAVHDLGGGGGGGLNPGTVNNSILRWDGADWSEYTEVQAETVLGTNGIRVGAIAGTGAVGFGTNGTVIAGNDAIISMLVNNDVAAGANMVSITDAGGASDAFYIHGDGGFLANGESTVQPTLSAAAGDEYALFIDYTTNKAAGDDYGLRVEKTDTSSPGTSYHIWAGTGANVSFAANDNGQLTLGNPTQSHIDSSGNRVMYWADDSTVGGAALEFDVAFGPLALDSMLTGFAAANNNSAFGYEAGTAVTSGDDNTMMGYQAGYTVTTGVQNVLIGSFADAENVDDQQLVALGYSAYGGSKSVAIGSGAYAPDTPSHLAIRTNDHYVTHRSGEEVQTVNSAVATTIFTLPIANNEIYHIKAYVTGINSTFNGWASYELVQTVYRVGGGNATLQGGNTELHVAESAAAWDAEIAVSGTDVIVQVTGTGLETINWDCTIEWWSSNDG